MNPIRSLSALFLFVLTAIANGFAAVEPVASGSPGFPLVVEGRAAVLVLPASAAEVVRIAATDFAADVERVTGVRPEILPTAPADQRPRVIITAEPPPALVGRWEAFQLSASPAVGNTPATLMVAGSDRRALAYGLYELSRRIGVSPWNWWADVPVVRQKKLQLSFGTEPIDQPAVKYRGIFLNDEGWGLRPWAAKTFEPEVGNLGPKTYAKIFELMLRLRANTIWPAMHPGTKAFHLVPGNAAAADAYAIVLGSSHAEPMLRNNVGEWKAGKDTYNYLENGDGVRAYWEQRVKERTSGESLFTLGMRGIHDSPIVGPKTPAERVALLEKIFADQRDLLARYLGKGDATRVAQLFCPYKEVLSVYEAGLRVPDDVTLLWPDDNFGYLRRYGTVAEQARSGGLGVYYHASYLGPPLYWLWLDSLAPALVWTEMTKAFEHGARTVWIVNVGDIKSTERSAEFFLDLAWHADRTSPAYPAQFIKATAARDFGPANADAIADILARHQSLAVARKPEHLQWHLPGKPYVPTELNEQEIVARLDAYAKLVQDTAVVAERLPADAKDAFFQLVGYPVQAAAATNERYFRAELARLQQARGDNAAVTTFARSGQADKLITTLTTRYNEEIAGGKWRHVITTGGVNPEKWKEYQPDPIPPLTPSASPAPIEAAVPKATPAPSRPPAGARPGDFFESAGVVSIHAAHFTAQSDRPDGGWRSIPGLGRTGSAVTVIPSNANITASAAPRLSYRFHVASSGPATIRVRLLPTYPIVPGSGLRLALALDDGPLLPLAVTDGFESRSAEWKRRVLANATEGTLKLPAPLSPGWHTLHLVAVDTGVVVDKIVIDLGGLQLSYDGPAETRVP